MSDAIDFSTFILSLGSAAYMALGLSPAAPEKGLKDLTLAKQNIDLLEILFTKTKGNLTGDEEKLFTHVLLDLRLKFNEALK